MLRDQLKDALKDAMRGRDEVGVATLRLILAALKDRDIAARMRGAGEPISDDEILSMLQGMIRQRRESIALYEQGGRPELAAREQSEIAVIERFLPQQMDETAASAVIAALIAELGAASIKDMGRVMGALRARYTGRMDMGQASALTKAALTGG